MHQIILEQKEWVRKHAKSSAMRSFSLGQKSQISNWDRNGTLMNAEHIRDPRPGAGRMKLSDYEIKQVEHDFRSWM